MMVGTFPAYPVLFFISMMAIGIKCLKDVEVVIPIAVQMMDTVTLQCKYDLEGEPLYTVKWYKGPKEFYRFIPKELPNTQIFPLPGIDVDLSKSTPNEVVLRNVQPEVTGRYKCEVSSDAPNFYTKIVSGYMYVIDIATDSLPSLNIEKDLVDRGDILKGNCTSPPSYPAPNMSWFLNGIKIPESYLKKVDVDSDSSFFRRHVLTTIGLDLEINDNTFQEGRANLSCVAELFKIYRGETREILEEAKPKPRPSSVLGPRDDSSDCRRPGTSILVVTLLFLLVEIHR